MIKRSNFLIIFSFVLLLVGSFFFNGCESSRVGPEVTVNVPAPPATPLLLQGSVYNSKTGLGVPGATVVIAKLDGTNVATVATGSSGNFSYDISSLTNIAYKLTATASGYGSVFTNVKVDPTNKTAEIASLALDPITSVAVALTPAGGTASANTGNQESKTGNPVTINVPANAVTTNTTINVAAPSVNNVPPPAAASTTAQVGVTNLTPAGVTFAKPVTLSFPLPYEFSAGDKVPVMELLNGSWQTSSLNATVDASGYTANLDLTKTGQFALLDNTTVSGSANGSVKGKDNSDSEIYPPMLKATNTLDSREFTLAGSNIVATLPNTITYQSTVTNQLKTPPTFSWGFNTLIQRFGLFLFPPVSYSSPFSTYTNTWSFNVGYLITWPGVPVALTVNGSGSGNAQFPNDTGSWSLKVVYETYTTTVFDVSIVNARWTVRQVETVAKWREQSGSRKWIWTGHNQGTVVYGGY